MNFLNPIYPTTAELNPREYCVLGNLSAVAVHQRGSHFCNEDQNLWKLLHPPPFAKKKAHYYEVSNRNDGKLAPVLVPTGSSPFPRPLLALSHSSSPRLPSVSSSRGRKVWMGIQLATLEQQPSLQRCAQPGRHRRSRSLRGKT